MSTARRQKIETKISTDVADVADVVIVGAGMAGAALAYELSATRRVVLIEREAQPGYHATGRSAALYSAIYGNAAVRALTRASRDFLDHPPPGFAEQLLLTPRGALLFGGAQQQAQLDDFYAEVAPLDPHIRRLDGDEVRRQLPFLKANVAAGGVFNVGAMDMDVHALHQGYLRGARANGARLLCDTGVTAIAFEHGVWRLTTRQGEITAACLVNAAGAWADELARLAGLPPIGITPLRRTALVVETDQTMEHFDWPMAIDADESLYFKPDAGRILLSPADETPSQACDAQPEEYDIAVAIDRFESVTELRVKKITGKWAGLRSFAPDRTPVIGFDARQPGFFWFAGQGGYGIQTAPGNAMLARALITGTALPETLLKAGVEIQAVSPQRFQNQGLTP
ncbi:MAG: FAD-binding oxidoreductase [Betaproteobacteria bacterium]|nr:FAD-binding oxidoreductase [Betaproteobacteria bacterium]